MAVSSVAEAELSWVYRPPVHGKALFGGGWKVEYNLGQVSASPEFSFPLQLVYLNSRTKRGLFGSQWFCPQLESSLLPVAQGYMMWTTPGNEQIMFIEGDRANQFGSGDGRWQAEVSRLRQVIRDQQGWQYTYAKGRLLEVRSPGLRILEFKWERQFLRGVQLRDGAGKARVPVLSAAYEADDCLSALKLVETTQSFKYTQRGSKELLSLWKPVTGEAMKFRYHPDSDVLQGIGTGDEAGEDDIEVIKTVYVKPTAEQDLAQEAAARKNPENYWISEDLFGSYVYGRKGKNNEEWNPSVVTITATDGSEARGDFSAQGGIMTSRQGGMERKEYYYRSPGQRYNGKLRRVIVGKKIVEEYRYDRRTGLLTERIDSRGKITFYDYDPRDRGKKGDWEPKPVRVRQGTRKQTEVIAEYEYSEDGRLTAAKDRLGRVTRYAYNARGDLEAVESPAGDRLSYEYDALGRMVASEGPRGRSEVIYDESGRAVSSVSPDGRVSEIKYAENGLPTAIQTNGAVAKEFVRGAADTLVGEKDALGRFTAMERDRRGNLLSFTAPNGAVTAYEYDSMNRRNAQIDGNGNRILFEYDTRSNLVKQTNPIGGVQRWDYDEATGRQILRSNGIQNISQTYDEEGQLVSLDYGSGQKVLLEYDAEGRQSAAMTPEAAFRYELDKGGRLEAVQATHDSEDYLFQFRYNIRDQREALLLSSRTSPTGPFVPFQQTDTEYDQLGNLSAIYSNGLPVISYTHDKTGRPLTKTFGSAGASGTALTATLEYDSLGRLTKTEWNGGKLTSPLLLSYNWDAADQLSSRSWNGQTLAYQYDAAGQLLSVTDEAEGTLLEAYRYDLAGNMLAKLAHGKFTAMTYNAANQLDTLYELDSSNTALLENLPKANEDLKALATSATKHHYDIAGRLLGTDPARPARYGWLDKLIENPLPGSGTVIHKYWPDGQIASITEGLRPAAQEARSSNVPAKETFLWDGLALIKRNDTIYIIEPHPSGGVPIASHPVGRPDEITYHLNDMLGTTLATVSKSGIKFTNLSSFGLPKASVSPSAASDTQSPAQPKPQITEPGI